MTRYILKTDVFFSFADLATAYFKAHGFHVSGCNSTARNGNDLIYTTYREARNGEYCDGTNYTVIGDVQEGDLIDLFFDRNGYPLYAMKHAGTFEPNTLDTYLTTIIHKPVKVVQGGNLYTGCRKVSTGQDDKFILLDCKFSGKERDYDFFVIIKSDFYKNQFDSKSCSIRIPEVKNPFCVRVDKSSGKYFNPSLQRAQMICPEVLQYVE